MQRISKRLTFANVVSVTALFVALGGTALASVIVTSNSEVARGTISGHQPPAGDHANIIGGSVNGADLALSSVGSGKLTANAVTSVKVADDSLTGADVQESTLNGGGDVTGPLSNLKIAAGTIGRSQLASGSPSLQTISFFAFSVPANGCQTQVFSDDQADLGEVMLAVPESADLGDGVYMRPTVIAHPGQAVLEICNSTGSAVTIPFGTFFDLRLIA